LIKEIIAKRYARSLISIGQEDGQYQQYGEELDRFDELTQSSEELREVLENPIYNLENQKELLKTLSGRLSLSPVVTNFLNLLLDKRRMSYFLDIVRQYNKLLEEILGVTTATIVSAIDLPNEDLEKIIERFSKVTGKEVHVNVEKDPSLIGGLVAKIGDTLYDGSIRTQLYAIKEMLGKG
jgi:F-type H+-transporting ATPase subunit delta